MQFVIDSMQALERLQADRTLRRALTRITIRRSTEGSRHRLEPALNKHYFGCGCVHGALAVYLGLVVGGAMWSLRMGLEDWRWWKLALIAFGCALLGKLLGIAGSKWRLHSIHITLKREFEDV